MTKALPRPNVEVAAPRPGLARLTAAERQRLASIEDSTVKQILGEFFIASRANQANFDEITQWYPLQPADVSYAVRDQITFRFDLREGFLEEFDEEQGVIEFLDVGGEPSPDMNQIEKVRVSLLDAEERNIGLFLSYISSLGAGAHRGMVMMIGLESGAFLAFELTAEAEGSFGALYREATVVPIIAGSPSPDFIYGEPVSVFPIGAVQGAEGEPGEPGEKGDPGEVGPPGEKGTPGKDAVPPERTWLSITTGELEPGASVDLALEIPAATVSLLMLETDAQARVRVYGDEAARAADAARSIGTDPEGDHGVQLDYANTIEEGGGRRRLTPVPVGVNLDAPAVDVLYLRVTNLSAAKADIEVSLLVLEEGD